jgi:putative DNA primase/helicase
MAEETHDGGDDAGDGAARAPAQLRLVRLPEARTLLPDHLEQLHASGLTDETIALANVYTEWRSKVIAELLNRRTFPRHHGAGLVFPLYLPGATDPYAYRVKPNTPRVNRHGKPVRYEQADERTAGVLVYFPPRARAGDGAWYRDVTRPLFWTEGEKKSLALDQLELACVGLTGVWNWLDSKHRQETGEWRLHPHIREHVTVAGRRHVIAFDADARTNDQVMHAAQRLAGVLAAAGAAEVCFVTPPTLQHKGIDDFYAAFGEGPTRALLDTAQKLEGLDPSSPLQLAKNVRALAGAPISEHMRLPEGYEIRRDGGLWRTGDAKHGDVKVATRPILIVRHLADYYTHEARVEVCYEREDAWIPLVVNRKALIDSRTMVAELGMYGAPVTSNSAPKIVDWLDELERVNPGIERVLCLSKTGWHTFQGERAFVLDRVHFADEHDRPVVLDTRGDRRKLFTALTARGESLQKHVDALRRAWEADPVCAAMICGGLAATLLEPLDVPNFAIHLPGDSSRGKTSMLKVAASVFGDPNAESWLGSWNTTATAAELRAQQLNDLPQCYDEVGTSDPGGLERMLYSLVNGGGRARGKADLSLRETATWRTVVLSTGERPLAGHDTMTGAQVRVIQLPVSGFGKLTAAEVDAVRDACAAHAGMFGRHWIESLLEIDDWAPFRATHKAITKKLRESAPDVLQGRVAGYFATLITAEIFAHNLGLGLAGGATMHGLYLRTDARELVLPLAERALALVRDWAMSEPDAFPVLETASDGAEEVRRYNGHTRHGFRRGDYQLCFIPASLRTYLDAHRMSPNEVLRCWRDRGWLSAEASHYDAKVRITGVGRPRLVILRLDTGPAPP